MSFDWPTFLATVDVSQFPLPLRFRYVDGYLITSFKPTGKDWIDCRPLSVVRWGVEILFVSEESAARGIIRREAQMAVLHELDECLRIGGQIVNDPHRRVPYPAEGT